MLTSHQQAALDISDHIALTANAGSGKTFVLSKRFLEIAVSGNVPIRKIAAITFTEKAASELYKKIAVEVENYILAFDDQKVIEKLKRIRQSLVSANISTIHSFCINLLREYPVEAGLDANFIPADGVTSNEMIELAIEELIKESLASAEDSVRIKSLIRLFGSKTIMARELGNHAANRKHIIELRDKLYYKDVNEIAEVFFSSFLNITGEYLSKKLPAFLTDISVLIKSINREDPENKMVPEIAELVGKLKEHHSTAEAINKLQQLGSVVCTQQGSVRKNLVRKLESGGGEIDRIEEFFADSAYFYFDDNHVTVETELAAAGKNYLYFFNRVIQRYEEKKLSKGIVDFEDILLLTRKLLENENVLKSVWEKFDYIMIDEYQDTNQIQYEIFLPVLDQLRRGNLFVVGDEKQSIYMFRDAELEVFEKTKRDIGRKSSGKLMILPDSFRMGDEICIFTNYVFRKLFADPDYTYNEVAYSELVCARQEPAPGGIMFLLEEEGGTSEADLTARKILELNHLNDISWSQIAVLSRKRKSFDELEEAFINYNIPYLILGGRNFYQRQSIYDIYSYFSFLLDNNNDGALAGILRSPFFNLSDSKLYEISLSSGSSFYQKLLNSKTDDLLPVKEKLEEMTGLAKSTDPPELLRKMLNDSDFLAYLIAKKNGIQENANIKKLVKLTINFYNQGLKSLYDYVVFLRKNIEQVEDEAQAVIADDSNTVKIMTIHQAKGLEFSAVFLFKSGETAQKSIVRQKHIVVNKNLGILTKVPLEENYYEDYLSAPIVNLNDFISRKKEYAELKRLLYVSVTRAKDFLFITAPVKGKYPEESFMGLLQKVFPEGFVQDQLLINENLKILLKKQEEYSLSEISKEIIIPVISEVEDYPASGVTGKSEEKILKTGEIPDSVKDEIISATKFSVYNHCPRKYKFTYEDGLLPLIRPEPNFSPENYDTDEDLTSDSNGIKGKVIHKILQEGKKQSDPDYVLTLIRKEEISLKNKSSADLAAEIINDLKKFYESHNYREIHDTDGKNEYEIYLRENDYILFGIVDRIVIKGNIITIIDYKTDSISVDKIEERTAEYLNQLKFYSYIIWKTFNSSLRIRFRIIFIRHPDKLIEYEESRSSLLLTGEKIQQMVENTRVNIFYPDRSYCSKCIYSRDHINCIKRD